MQKIKGKTMENEKEIFDFDGLIDNSDMYVNALLAEATAARKKQISDRAEKKNTYSNLIKAGENELENYKKSTLAQQK